MRNSTSIRFARTIALMLVAAAFAGCGGDGGDGKSNAVPAAAFTVLPASGSVPLT